MFFKSATMSRSIAAALMLTVAAASIYSAHAMGGKLPQKTSNSSVISAKNQAQKKASKDGKQKAKERQELTGRYRQGNHDSLTKPNKSGAKGEKHANGVRQAGAAGSSKKK